MRRPPSSTEPGRRLELLSTHGRALILLGQQPDLRLRDLAGALAITERTACMIVAELERAGYLQRHRVGRRNHYDVAIPPLLNPVETTPARRPPRPPDRPPSRTSDAS